MKKIEVLSFNIPEMEEEIKEEITIPIYFYQKGKKIIIDEESIYLELKEKLKEINKNPKKFLEI